MSTVLEHKAIQLIKQANAEQNQTECVNYLLNIAQNADAPIKNEIENRIVQIGAKAIPDLINCIQNCKGTARGLASMSIIRIGNAAIPFLQEAATLNTEFNWIAEYLIKEIEGSQISLAG